MISGTTLARRRSVPRSCTMLEDLVVMRRRKRPFSRGWYTYRTVSVSTNVCCCLEVEISFGNAARSPSILRRGISRNWRERRDLVPFWDRIDTDRTTCW